MSDLTSYKRVARSLAQRVANDYQVPLDISDIQKLETLAVAMYWVDRYLDQTDSFTRAKNLQHVLAAAHLSGEQNPIQDPDARIAVEDLRQFVNEFSTSRQADFYRVVNTALECAETLRTTKDIQTFFSARRKEAICSADLCALTFIDKINALEESKREIFWRGLHNYAVERNYGDSFIDARKDWKNKEIRIRPLVLRLNLLFASYKGKPPYLHYAGKYFKKWVKRTAQKAFKLEPAPHP